MTIAPSRPGPRPEAGGQRLRNVALVVLVVLVALAGEVAAKRKRNLQKSIWEPLAILGIIIACLVVPLLVMLVWRVAADPATPLIAKELWFKLKECCCDDGRWRARQRHATRRARREADASGFPSDRHGDAGEADEGELSVDDVRLLRRARRERREDRRDRRRNLEQLADEVLADDLRRAVEEAAARQ